MLIAGFVCFLIATTVLGVCNLIVKNKTLCVLLQILSLVSLAASSAIALAFENSLNRFGLWVILSILPQFLSLFNFKEWLNKTKEENPEKSASKFLNSDGTTLEATSYLLTAICFVFCGLYLGLETFLGVMLGLALGGLVTFLLLALKKINNTFDALNAFLRFSAAGLLLSSMLTVLVYEVTLANLLFAFSSVLLASYFVLTYFYKTKYLKICYYLAMFLAIFVIIL